ncbi:hypothetical protein PMAYCL1PPCAC_15168, partial [Pristionchus mayeri]
SAYQKMEENFDSLDEMELTQPLYEDKFCKLFPGKLEIVRFYFPTAKSKIILIKDIKTVYYKRQVLKEDLLLSKGWGKNFSNIWWACDMNRTCRDVLNNGESAGWYNIVIDNGEKTLKGFSSTNYDSFIQALRPFLPKEALVMQGMP